MVVKIFNLYKKRLDKPRNILYHFYCIEKYRNILQYFQGGKVMKRTLLLSALLIMLAVPVSLGQVPQTISYQGVLTNTDGTTVPDREYRFIFKLYDEEGNELWSEEQLDVKVKKGVFNVILGSVNPLDLSFDQPYQLGVTVEGGSELTPQIELTSSPYSLNPSTDGDSPWTVSGDDIYRLEGNVGIGTTLPGALRGKNLHIDGVDGGSALILSGSGISTLRMQDANVAMTWDINLGATGQALSFWNPVDNSSTMVIYPGGNVGIGTEEPTALRGANLEIAGGDGGSALLLTGSGGTSTLRMENPEMTWDINLGDRGQALNFWNSVASGSVMAIHPGGNLSIGTPEPGGKLHVYGGKTLIESTDYLDGQLRILNIADTNDKEASIGFFAGAMRWVMGPGATTGLNSTKFGIGSSTIGTNFVTIQSDGNIGIGTTNPGAPLHIAREGSGITNNLIVAGGSHQAGDGVQMDLWSWGPGYGAKIRAVNTASSPSELQPQLDFIITNVSHDTVGMSIKHNGNVGMGTTNPAAKLHVWGNLDDTRIQIEKEGSGYAQFGYDTTGSYIFERNASNPFRIYTGGQERMRFTSAGNVGIGTMNPGEKLAVNSGSINPIASFLNTNSAYSEIFVGGSISSNGSLVMGFNQNNDFGYLGVCGDDLIGAGQGLVIADGGNVGIGTTNPQSKLAVNGTITAQEVVVTLDGWADYVFEDDYQSMPLDELEQSIKKNKHLPGIPSAEEVAANGVNVGEMQAKLLQKVEELTLYVIELKKENEQLKRRVESLEK